MPIVNDSIFWKLKKTYENRKLFPATSFHIYVWIYTYMYSNICIKHSVFFQKNDHYWRRIFALIATPTMSLHTIGHIKCFEFHPRPHTKILPALITHKVMYLMPYECTFYRRRKYLEILLYAINAVNSLDGHSSYVLLFRQLELSIAKIRLSESHKQKVCKQFL